MKAARDIAAPGGGTGGRRQGTTKGPTPKVTRTCDTSEQARTLYRDLIGYGCPVVLCTPRRDYQPGDSTDLIPQDEWQTAEPDAGVVERYQPGRHTAALVTGHVLDGIDVDTKHGADVGAILDAANRHGVTLLGVHTTPSGGLHLLVASTGIASAANTTTGVDFRGGCTDGSGRGLLYLPGSTRPKYPGKGYAVATPIDWDALPGVDVDEQRDALCSFLADPLAGITPRLTAGGGDLPVVAAEPVPDLPRGLADKIADLDAAPVGKRSNRFHHLVGECYRAGLTQGETVGALTGWCHAVGKYVGRVDVEVARCWPKLEADDPQPWDTQTAETAETATATPDARHVVLTNAASIEPKPTTWVWSGRLPVGSLGLLAGPEGTGKSTCGYWIAARLTRGELPGVHHGSPRDVLIAATEDSWSRTIVPRLIAAGADRERVWRVEVVTSLGTGGYLTLPKDVPGLATHVTDKGAAMILLDPIMSRLDSGLDTHKDAETRRALEPIAALADHTGVAVLGLIHFNKGGSAEVLNNVMASKAFTAVARSVSTVIRDPNDDSGRTRIFGTPKSNLGPDDLPLLPFQLVEHTFANGSGEPITTSRIEWLTERQGSIGDLMRQARDSGEDRTVVAEVAEWLTEWLSTQGDRAPRKDIIDAARKERYSEVQVRRARERLGLQTRRKGYPSVSWWMTAAESEVWDASVDHASFRPPSQVTVRGECTTDLTDLTGAQSGQLGQSGQPRASVTQLQPASTEPSEPPPRCEACGTSIFMKHGEPLCANCKREAYRKGAIR